MSEQAEFAVPKDRQDVAVWLYEGRALTGTIFLDYTAAALDVHHRMVAFLEDGSIFFPLVLKGGGTEFIHKKNIKLIELNCGDDGEQLETTFNLMHTVNITAVFTDEGKLSGSLLADVPVEKTRLSDCLNLPDKFLNVRIDTRIYYINKDSLRKVIYAATK